MHICEEVYLNSLHTNEMEISVRALIGPS